MPWRHTVVRGAAEVVDGHIALPTAPGLGIELNLAEIARYGLLPVEHFEYQLPHVNLWR